MNIWIMLYNVINTYISCTQFIMRIVHILVLQLLYYWSYTQFTYDGELSITMTDSRVQQLTDYIFQITLVANDPLQINSVIEINLPSNYKSTAATTYPCSVVSWPFLGSSLTCIIQYRILKVTGGFPQIFSITQDTIFQFVLNDLKNPSVAEETGAFSGRIIRADLTLIVSISATTIIISPGHLQVALTVSPSTVNTDSDLIVTVTPTHPIPLNGYIRLYTPTNYWTHSNTLNPQQIFKSSTTPTCHAVSANLPSNLYCTYSTSSLSRTLKIYNVVSGALTQLNEQFTFKISIINSPPTTQNQGQFQVATYLSSNAQVDSSDNNKVSGLTPRQILSPSIQLINYVNSQNSQCDISVTIRSIITATDKIVIKIPNQILLTSLSIITMQGIQIADFEITAQTNFNILSFKGVIITNPIQVTILLSQIINPSSVMTTGYFSIWTQRNNNLIDQVLNAFRYTTIAGDINVTITPINYQAGIQTDYTLQITTTRSLQLTDYIQIIFPSDDFNIETGSTLQCSSNLSPTCTISAILLNIVKISGFISSGEHNLFYIVIKNIKNPQNIGLFSSFIVTSYTSSDNLIDQEQNGIQFTVLSRQLGLDRITITSTSNMVNRLANFDIVINPYNPIPVDSILRLTIPTQLSISGLSCSPYYCNLYSGTTYDITLVAVPSNTPFTIKLNNVRNSKSTAPTQTFQIRISNSVGNQLQYRVNSLTYAATTPAPLSVNLIRTSTVNSARGVEYTFQLGITFTYSSIVSIVITFPNKIQCSGCAIQQSNTTHYSILKGQLQFNSENKIETTLTGFVNHYSYEVQQIVVTIYSENVVDKIAQNTVQIVNNQPGVITFTHGFTPRQLSTATTLTISNLSPIYNQFNYLQISFGPEFDISGTTLSSGSSSYSLIIDASSKTLKLTKLTTNLNGFGLSGIITPGFTPSTAIKLRTYTISNDIIDQSAEFTWSHLCTIPCKSCVLGETSKCLSCYTDPALVQSRVLYLATDNTCNSICPDKFYHKTSTDSCETCSAQCTNCYETAGKCLSCPTTPNSLPYLLDNVCYSQCPDGYYAVDTTIPKRCLRCDYQNKHCKTCSSFQTCNNCLNNYYFYLSQCYDTCPADITVANSFTWNCDSCTTNCRKCNTGGCFECQSGFLLDTGFCYLECRTSGFVPHNGVCRGCDTTCLTCSTNIYNCLTCDSTSLNPYYFQNKCLQTCPNGYYKDTSLYICLQCTQPCEYCTTSSITSCTSCIDTFSLLGSSCKSTCPDQFYNTGSTCQPCQNNCLTCRSSRICMSCVTDYSLFVEQCRQTCLDGYISINQKCVQCSSNCKTCSLVNFCTSCFSGTYLFEGTCMYPCPSKYYQQITSVTIFECLPCSFECAQCQSALQCNSCVGGYQLSGSSTCVSLCDPGFVPLDSICQPCSTSCQTCIYIQLNCSSCETDKYSFRNTSTNIGSCYNNCPASVFSHQQSKTCLYSCPALTYIDQPTKFCIQCPNLCLVCSSNTHCSSCQTGASMYQTLCYESCPPAAQYSVSGICKTCNIVQCYQCSGALCNQCNSGFLLVSAGSTCINSCGSNQQYNSQLKQCQALPSINNNTNNTNTTDPTTTNQTTTTNNSSDINFVPMPFMIVGVIAAGAIVLLYFTHTVSMFGMLYWAIWVLLFCSGITAIITTIVQAGSSFSFNIIKQQTNTTRLLQQSTSITQNLPSINISTLAILLILSILVINLLLSIITVIIHLCMVRIQRYRIVIVLTLIIGIKLLGGLLCSNFCRVNMRRYISSNKNNNHNVNNNDNNTTNNRNKFNETGSKLLPTISQNTPKIKAKTYYNNNIKLTQQQYQQILTQYTKYWKIYDKLQLITIVIDILLITAGILLAFHYQKNIYQFYGGIQLVVLGIIDMVLTIFWYIGRDKLAGKQPSVDQDDITNNQSLGKINQQGEQYDDQLSEGLNYQKWAKTQKIVTKRTRNIRDKQQQQNQQYEQNYQKNDQIMNQSRAYKSQYHRPKDAIKLNKQQIQQAIKRGIYRRNKASLAQQQRLEDEESALGSANKFNLKQKQQQIFKQISVEKEGNIDKTNKIVNTEDDNQNNKNNDNNVQNNQKQLDQQFQANTIQGRQATQIQKQFNDRIIFEDMQQESLDTHPEQQKSIDSIQDNKDKSIKKQDSLGSLQNTKNNNNNNNNNSTVFKPQNIEQIQVRSNKQKTDSPQLINKQSKSKQLKIQDIQERSNQDSSDRKQGKFINIFEHQLLDETQYDHSINKNQRNKFKSTREMNQIIYADLESVGTVQQLDIYEDQGKNVKRNRMPQFSLELDNRDEGEDRPGQHINTNFRYTNNNFNKFEQNKEKQSMLPRKIPIKKKKRNATIQYH